MLKDSTKQFRVPDTTSSNYPPEMFLNPTVMKLGVLHCAVARQVTQLLSRHAQDRHMLKQFGGHMRQRLNDLKRRTAYN